MPRRDGSGPVGMGPKTGRGMGPCGGGAGQGSGYGRRGIFGRGFGWFWRVSEKDKNKKEVLKEEAQYLKEDLEKVEKELIETEK